MAIVGSFDGVNRLLLLSPHSVSHGEMSFNAADLLAEIIDWRNGPASSPYNDRFIRPARAVGGDSKGGGARVGTSVFLMNDWKIGFPDQSLIVIVQGELLTDQQTHGGDRFYYGNLSPSSRVTVLLETPAYSELIEVSSSGTIGSSFTNADRATLSEIRGNLSTLVNRINASRPRIL
jgi:hypothetical protein